MYKTLIQLVLLIILILIIFFISNKYFSTENKINIESNSISSNKKNNSFNKNLDKKNIDNEIINLSYEKFDTNGNKYLIKAERGMLDSESPNIIYMNQVEASLIYLNNERLTINSEKAIFDKENFKTIFSNKVKLEYQDQILLSDILEFLIDKNIAIFKDNVKYYNHDTEMYADIVFVNLLTKEIDIKSNNKKKIIVKKN